MILVRNCSLFEKENKDSVISELEIKWLTFVLQFNPNFKIRINFDFDLNILQLVLFLVLVLTIIAVIMANPAPRRFGGPFHRGVGYPGPYVPVAYPVPYYF